MAVLQSPPSASDWTAVPSLEPLRVVFADDEPHVRAALRGLLGQMEGFLVVGEAATAAEAVLVCEQHRPDVALVDVSMPGDGARAVEAIVRDGLAGRVVALSAHDDPHARQRMAAAGADAYVLKGGSEDLVAVLRGVSGA